MPPPPTPVWTWLPQASDSTGASLTPPRVFKAQARPALLSEAELYWTNHTSFILSAINAHVGGFRLLAIVMLP